MSPGGEQSGRSPVLLLHGQPGTARAWDAVVPGLSRHHRLLVPDRPGYGRSALEPAGLGDNAELAAACLVARDAAPATVVGHSWAGGVAVLLAARHPELVHSLVLVGSVGAPQSVTALDRLLAVPGAGDALAAAGMAGAWAVLGPLRRGAAHLPPRWGSRLAALLPDDELQEDWRDVVGRIRHAFVVEQRALVDELDAVQAALPEVRVPTTVVSGTWDVVVPLEASRFLADSIPGARLQILDGVGHFVARDAPEALIEVITAAATDRRGLDPMP